SSRASFFPYTTLFRSQVGEQSFNVGRNAVLAAGLPESIPGTTVDRQCGSSQQAIHAAAAQIIAGHADVVVAGGVEVMSRTPMFRSEEHTSELQSRFEL